nr:neurofilament medium polypeptide-like [Ipomoea batatas]
MGLQWSASNLVLILGAVHWNPEAPPQTLPRVRLRCGKARHMPTANSDVKRKRPSQVKENGESVKEENGVGTKTNSKDLIKSVGFRQNGSRRKSKPRRAAEVGVECR